MDEAITMAAGGLRATLGQFDKAAANLAGNPENAAAQLVALKQARMAAGADVAVILASGRMQKSLLDILT